MRNSWEAKSLAAQRHATSQQSGTPAGNDGNADGVVEKDKGLDHTDEITSPVGDVPVSTNTEDRRPKLGSWTCDDPVSTACYISYSYYQFLVINTSNSFPPHHFRFLDLQGCLYVPRPQILDQFVRRYFLRMRLYSTKGLSGMSAPNVIASPELEYIPALF